MFLSNGLQKINVMQKLLVCNTQPWKEEKNAQKNWFSWKIFANFFFQCIYLSHKGFSNPQTIRGVPCNIFALQAEFQWGMIAWGPFKYYVSTFSDIFYPLPNILYLYKIFEIFEEKAILKTTAMPRLMWKWI